MIGLWHHWVERCFRPIDARALAWLRIGLGTVTALDMLRTWAHGLVPWLYRLDGEGIASAGPNYLLQPLGPEGPVYAFYTALVAYICVALGAFTRPAIVVAVLAGAQLGTVGPMSEQGVDHIVRTTLLILLFAPCDARWAVGPSRRRDQVPAWAFDLVVFLLVLVYMNSGFCKIVRDWDAWTNLAARPATFRIMADPLSGVVDPEWGIKRLWLFRALDTLTLVFELGAFVLLTRMRAAWGFMGVALHVGLALTMKLGQFPYVMLVYYPLLFLPDPRWSPSTTMLDGQLERLRRLRSWAPKPKEQAEEAEDAEHAGDAEG